MDFFAGTGGAAVRGHRWEDRANGRYCRNCDARSDTIEAREQCRKAFRIGDAVAHPQLGEGVVYQIESDLRVVFGDAPPVVFVTRCDLVLVKPAIGTMEDWSSTRLIVEVERLRARVDDLLIANNSEVERRRNALASVRIAHEECDRLRAERDKLITGIIDLARVAAPLGGTK